MITLDGLPLTNPGKWRLNTDTVLRIFPERTAADGALPGRDGSLPSLGSRYEPGAVVLGITLYGADRAGVEANAELLYGVLGQRHRLLTLADTVRGREAKVEVLESVEPERVGQRMWKMGVALRAPSVFWRSPATVDSTQPIPQGASNPSPFLTEFGGGTGPINDALIRFRGNFSQVILEDIVSGDRLTVNQAATSTQYVVVDTANWVARLHSTDTWDLVGGTDVINSVVSNRGSGPMFTLNPDFVSGAGRYQMRITGAINATTSPLVTVRAKKSFI